MLDPNTNTLTRATHLLRSTWSATLLFDDSPFDTQCMIDPRSGDFILAATSDALRASDITLACPRDSFDAQIRISIELLESTTEEQADRFTAYHLPATKPLLALGTFQYAKLDSGEVVSQDECSLINPLVSNMGKLCKALNADRSRLSSLCNMLSGVAHDSPLAVGVDSTGIDIRASFGLTRLTIPTPIPNQNDAMSVIQSLLESCNA